MLWRRAGEQCFGDLLDALVRYAVDPRSNKRRVLCCASVPERNGLRQSRLALARHGRQLLKLSARGFERRTSQSSARRSSARSMSARRSSARSMIHEARRHGCGAIHARHKHGAITLWATRWPKKHISPISMDLGPLEEGPSKSVPSGGGGSGGVSGVSGVGKGPCTVSCLSAPSGSRRATPVQEPFSFRGRL